MRKRRERERWVEVDDTLERWKGHRRVLSLFPEGASLSPYLAKEQPEPGLDHDLYSSSATVSGQLAISRWPRSNWKPRAKRQKTGVGLGRTKGLLYDEMGLVLT